MNDKKILQTLGLAMRAGKVVTGEEQVLKGLRSGKVEMILLAGDASENTKKKFHDKCKSYKVNLYMLLNRELLGHAIGKGERVVLGITDVGFARQINKLREENTGVIK